MAFWKGIGPAWLREASYTSLRLGLYAPIKHLLGTLRSATILFYFISFFTFFIFRIILLVFYLYFMVLWFRRFFLVLSLR